MNNSKNKPSLLEEIESEAANLLLDKLEHQKISIKRASQIAKFVLSALPENMDDEAVKEIIPKLDDKFFELADIVYKHMIDYEEKYKPLVLGEVEELIKHKHFDQAHQLMKKYFQEN